MTIKEAIKEAMRRRGEPMTASEAYEAIVADGLYEFGAANPKAVVLGEIRRHCVGVVFDTASSTKHFEVIGGNKYYFLEEPVTQAADGTGASQRRLPAVEGPMPNDLGVSDVKRAQERHRATFRKAILEQLKCLTPEQFEHFTKNLLKAYGFEDVTVTPYTGDGGIDGFGKLRFGFGGLINAAFQCKRYTSQPVGRSEIAAFRGSTQGQYELGLFFTTSRFTSGCKDLMFQSGAVPIIMVDGEGIVDIMIEKGFGVETESVAVYINAIDFALSDE